MNVAMFVIELNRLVFLFILSTNKTTACFTLIHCDIWGPYRTPSYSGVFFFFFTIVDDYSRATWVYLMRHKSDSYYFITTFCTMMHTHFGIKVQQFLSDNGLEFTSTRMTDFFHKNGILHQLSCVDTP